MAEPDSTETNDLTTPLLDEEQAPVSTTTTALESQNQNGGDDQMANSEASAKITNTTVIATDVTGAEHFEDDREAGLQAPLSGQAHQGSWERGQIQPIKFRDPVFGILFSIIFVAVIIHGFVSIPQILGDIPRGRFTVDAKGLIASSLCISVTILFAGLMLSFFSNSARIKKVIEIGLIVPVVSSGITAIYLLFHGLLWGTFLAVLGGVWMLYYYYCVKDQIPFVSANLNCAIDAVRKNKGVFLVGVCINIVMIVWITLWVVSMMNVAGYKFICDRDGNDCSVGFDRPGFIVVWALFLLWAVQVMLNVISNVTAGATASWYFNPADSGCCSTAVRGAVKRSLTSSFGSICLGSLLAAVVQLLHAIVKSLRNRGDDERREGRSRGGAEMLLLCCLDCLLQLIEDLVQYFNKWAFIYVAIYGYPYCTSGKRVMTLFQQRGWTMITGDYLTSIACQMIGAIIALHSIIVTMIVTGVDIGSTVFQVSIGVSVIIVGVMQMTLNSAACTTIVCFAEAPAELDSNHGAHSREIHEAWQKAYPMLAFL